MKSFEETTVHLKVTFQDRNLVHPVLQDLGRDGGRSVNILRGRVTPKDASLELEVTGTPRNLEDLDRLSASWGASVRASVVGVA